MTIEIQPKLNIPDQLNNLLAKSTFDKLVGNRGQHLLKWENQAGWTLPYLYTPFSNDSQTAQQHDYQAVGAQVTNHLANKIITILFPHNRPFFRYDLNQDQQDALADMDLADNQIQEILSVAENIAMKNLAKKHMRTILLEAIKAIIVLGNSLLVLSDDPDKKAQVYNLQDYAVLRDMSGEPYLIITRDAHVIATLQKDIQALVRTKRPEQNTNPDDKIEIYTTILRNTDGRFIVWQEIDNLLRIPKKFGVYTKDTLRWLPLTWNLSRGHNYGTSLVEEYSGDFHALSSMAEALVNITAIVADIKILVDPMGQTDVPTLNDSSSGTFIYGNADDISFLNVEKAQDMTFLQNQMATYEQRIGRGFLFSQAAQRDAERVTAEEIRRDAIELEGALGGIYGRLAENLQEPIAKQEKAELGDEFKDIEPTIISGLEALSRTSELDDLLMMLRDLGLISELPETVQDWIKFGELITIIGAARRVKYKKFLNTSEEAQANRDARVQEQQPQQQTQPQQQEQQF